QVADLVEEQRGPAPRFGDIPEGAAQRALGPGGAGERNEGRRPVVRVFVKGLRNEPLPDTAISNDQQVCGARRQVFDPPPEQLHRATVTDEVVSSSLGGERDGLPGGGVFRAPVRGQRNRERLDRTTIEARAKEQRYAVPRCQGVKGGRREAGFVEAQPNRHRIPPGKAQGASFARPWRWWVGGLQPACRRTDSSVGPLRSLIV